MFRELRRIRQQLPEEVIRSILENHTYGILSVTGDDGYPYGVPLNYVYDGENFYFHCAKEGHKIDGIQRSDRVSFCVVGDDEVVASDLTTAYASVIAFGRAEIVREEQERLRIFRLLIRRFSPGYEAEGEAEIKKYDKSTTLIKLRIEHIDGKAGNEWWNRQKKGVIS